MIITLKGKKPRIGKDVYIAESARIIGEVTIGERSSIWPNAVLRADIEPIKIGKCSSIQDGVLVHVNWDLPAVVGDYVTVGHGAIFSLSLSAPSIVPWSVTATALIPFF